MYWLGEMCEELQERLDLDLEMNNRKAKLLVFHAAVHLVCKVEPQNIMLSCLQYIFNIWFAEVLHQKLYEKRRKLYISI